MARAISQIRAALDDHDRLLIALQPVVELDSGRINAVEALARFPGLIGPPASVFSQGWSVGLGGDLELAVLDRALTLLPQLPAESRLTVNASPDVVTDELFIARLGLIDVIGPPDRGGHRACRHRQLSGDRQALAPPRAGGLCIAVDDAGAGFASFATCSDCEQTLSRLTARCSRGSDQGKPAPRALFTALVKIATEVDASVTAEGVETLEELAELRLLGVTHVQGYLLGGPTTDPTTWRSWRHD